MYTTEIHDNNTIHNFNRSYLDGNILFSLLFISTTVSNMIGKWLHIAVRTNKGSSILLSAFFSIKNSCFVCQPYLQKTLFCIKFEHKQVSSLLFGSSTVSTMIEEWLYIAVKKGLPSFWLYSSALKAHSLLVNLTTIHIPLRLRKFFYL